MTQTLKYFFWLLKKHYLLKAKVKFADMNIVFCWVQLCPWRVSIINMFRSDARQVCAGLRRQLQGNKNTILEIISLHDGFWKSLTNTNLFVLDHLFLDGPQKLPKFYYSMIDKSVWLLQHLTPVCLTLTVMGLEFIWIWWLNQNSGSCLHVLLPLFIARSSNP